VVSSSWRLLPVGFGRFLIFDSGFFDVLFAGLAVGTPEGLRGEWAQVGRVGRLLLVKDVGIEHGSQQQRHGRFEIEILRQNTARDAATQYALEALAWRLHDAMAPRLTEFRMKRGIRDHRRHHAIARVVELVWRLTREYRGEITLQITGVNIFGLAVEAVDHQHNFKQQGFLIIPVVVDGGLADAGCLRDGIHTGGLNAALCKQRQRGVENFFVCFETTRANHN
jgi:hypothetical protein